MKEITQSKLLENYINGLISRVLEYKKSDAHFLYSVIISGEVDSDGCFNVHSGLRKKYLHYMDKNSKSLITNSLNSLQKIIKMEGSLKDKAIIEKVEVDEFEADKYKINHDLFTKGILKALNEGNVQLFLSFSPEKPTPVIAFSQEDLLMYENK
jgi:hypothetical protein